MQTEGTYEQRIKRAKELLKTMRHAALATVSPDGSPHNSPVFSTWDSDLNFYWASGPQTQHSRNIAKDPRVFVVVFDSIGKGGGLYMKGEAVELTAAALPAALAVVNANRVRWGRDPASADYYQGDSPQRLYKATRHTAWVNVTEYDKRGLIWRERRREVTPHDLLQ
jgi:putative heme iron utilization protein